MCSCNHKEIDFELGRLHDLIAEKDREIERLEAEVEARTSTTGERCDQIRRAIGVVECLAWDLVVEQVADLNTQLSASQAREREAVERAEKAEQDSKTLNELGHALGRCYCTDSGCYTAEPEHLMERVRELIAKEDQEWDYHGVRFERDKAKAALAAALKALEDERNRAAAVIAKTFTWGDGQAVTEEEARAALNGDSHD